MKKLENKFSKKGVTFEKVFENDKFYIYRTNIGSFEGFKKKVRQEKLFNEGKHSWEETGDIEEFYPSDENFGNRAWSFNDKYGLEYVKNKMFEKILRPVE